MGYRKINNLYKDIRILSFKECYALEKIHGTSAHITYKDGKLSFFSGGAQHETFVWLFNEAELVSKFEAIGYGDMTVYGEAYGGKMQRMQHTYGDKLRFIAFEVLIGDDHWQTVPRAHELCAQLGLDFVAYEKGPATVEWLDSQRDLPSRQAKRLGITEDRPSEGIVVRTVNGFRDARGNRIICKHKGAMFSETKTPREVDPEQLKVMSVANDIAEEWVTPMRLEHVLDKMPEKGEVEHTGLVIKAMIADVKAESEGEVVWSKVVERAIGRETSKLYIQSVSLI